MKSRTAWTNVKSACLGSTLWSNGPPRDTSPPGSSSIRPVSTTRHSGSTTIRSVSTTI